MLTKRTAIGVVIGLLSQAPLAYAHGGMAAPNEIGPPILTSVALGFVCYWVVILWPSSKRKGDAPTNTDRVRNGKRRGRKRPATASADTADLPRLTKIAGRGGS